MDQHNSASPNLVANGAHLLRTGKFSDLTLVCQQREFLVHKAIVCIRSPVLAAATDGHFKEAKANQVEVDVVEAATLQHALAYLYTGEYDDEALPSIDYLSLPALETQLVLSESHDQVDDADLEAPDAINSNSRLQINTHVYIFADYYQIPELQQLAVEKFKTALKDFDREGFTDVCHLVYSSAPPAAIELRSSLTLAVANHSGELIEDAVFMANALSFPELLRDAFAHVVQENQIISAERIVAIAKRAETEEALREVKLEAAAERKEGQRKEDAIISRVNAADRCRHCGLESNLHFEGLSLRCSCRTRYFS